MQILAGNLSGKQSHFLLDSIVCPRPIFLVSTVNKKGTVNLAPFSMSTIASTNPPMICFSPGPGVRPNVSEKDTLANIRETGEFVVNMVTEDMLENVLVAAKNFPPDVSELEHTSFTAGPGQRVAPPRILEAPVNMECIVHQIIPLGNHNLIIGEVLIFHIADRVYTGIDIDSSKLSIIGRMGSSYFVKTTEIFSKLDKWDLGEDHMIAEVGF